MSAIPDILEQLKTAVDEDKAEFTLTNMQEQTQATEQDLLRRVKEHLAVIYPDQDLDILSGDLVTAISKGHDVQRPVPHKSHWDQSDSVVITYGNTIKKQ